MSAQALGKRQGSLFVYRRMIATVLRSQMQYKASFLLVTFGIMVNCGVEFGAIFALFSKFGGLPGWTLYEVFLFYGMTGAAFSLCEGWMRGFDRFHNTVRTGEFDKMLLRPRPLAMLVLGGEMQAARVGRLLVSVVLILRGIAGLEGALFWTDCLLMALSVLGGMLLYGGILFCQATMSFWTVEPLEIWNAITYGGVEVTSYPLSIYGEKLRQFFTGVVPLACVNYWPLMYILRGQHGVMAWLSPWIGGLCFAGGLCLWRLGVRHYTSTGS